MATLTPNIKFNYLYRDAGNYKVAGFVIFKNPEKLQFDFIENEIPKHLIDSEFFDPYRIKIPRLKHLDFPYDPELDHSWNEFSSIEMTEEPANDERSIQTFLTELEKAHSFAK